MFIDGEDDTSYDATYLAPPAGMNWPANIKKALADYEKIWHEWADTELDLQALLIDRDNAPAADADLMRAAVREGKPDPGTPTQARAERAVIYAKELTRQKASKARAAGEKIVADLVPHNDTLILEAIALERTRIQALVTAQQAARDAWIQADDNARDIGTTLNWLIYNLNAPHTRQYRVEYTPITVSWPAHHELEQPMINQRLEGLEALITPPAPVERTSENSFDNQS